MNILHHSKKIPGLQLIAPLVFHDFRGEYVETFNKRNYVFRNLEGDTIDFVEDDISVSSKTVLRGMHGDSKTWKLVQCLSGSFYIVVIDFRKDLPSYLNWEAFTLNDKNRHQLLIPAGCANGHLVLSDQCIFSYKQSEYYTGAKNQFTIRWDDPKIGIRWPISNPMISQRDSDVEFL